MSRAIKSKVLNYEIAIAIFDFNVSFKLAIIMVHYLYDVRWEQIE
jgi:hypothetical protein